MFGLLHEYFWAEDDQARYILAGVSKWRQYYESKSSRPAMFLDTRHRGRLRMSDINDELILAARLLLAALFLIFGWRKLTDYSGTVSQMAQFSVPMPLLAAAAATFMELPVAFAVAVGAFARLSALLMFFYTLGTALFGHRYWTQKGAARIDNMDGFYKNLGIMGGFLLLYITGAGNYSLDALRGIVGP